MRRWAPRGWAAVTAKAFACFQNSALGQGQSPVPGPQGLPQSSLLTALPGSAPAHSRPGVGLRGPLLTIQAAGGLKLPLNAGNWKVPSFL